MDVVKLGAYLFFIAAVSAAALSATSSATKKRIDENRAKRVQESYNKVMPDAAKFEECALKPETGAKKAKKAFDKNGKLIGYVAELEPSGYADKIAVVVGLTFESKAAGAEPSLHISGVSIARDNETPGLGKKINKSAFLDQFNCKSAGHIRLKKDPAAGTVDAITAATISSRAVTDAIRKLMENFGEVGPGEAEPDARQVKERLPDQK
jgi:electron transport complex protein RnfG